MGFVGTRPWNGYEGGWKLCLSKGNENSSGVGIKGRAINQCLASGVSNEGLEAKLNALFGL